MATPVIQSSASATSTSAGGTLTITKPTGLSAGDLMVAIFGGGLGTSTNLPAGWTNLENAFSSNNVIRACYKIADSGDAAASNFSFTATTPGQMIGILMRITGHPAANPVADSQLTTDTTTFNLNPVRSDALLILARLDDDDGTFSTFSAYTISGTNPTWTELLDNQATDAAMGVAYATANSANTITSADVTKSGSTAKTFRLLIAISDILDATVTLDAVALTSATPDLTLQMDAAVTLDAVALTASVQDPTTATPTPTWNNADKTAAANVTNLDKS